jgi:hypothetical protein
MSTQKNVLDGNIRAYHELKLVFDVVGKYCLPTIKRISQAKQ